MALGAAEPEPETKTLMACMEHVCRICDWATFDNQARTRCPRHPEDTAHYFDEARDHGDEERGLDGRNEDEEDECPSESD